MKRILSPLFLAMVALALFISPALAAAPAPKASPTPPQRHTVISSISADSITVDTGKSTQTYKIDKNTEFLYEGKKVAVSELKQGMRVSVIAAFTPKTAGSISASSAPKPEPTPTPKPAPKSNTKPTPKK